MNKGDRTKKYIIEQSSSLFNKQGYKSTSISDIMTATGLQKGGIYNHFENKDRLAKESFNFSINILKQQYKDAVSGSASAYKQLNAFLSVFKTLSNDEVIVGGCPLMNAAIEADDSKVEFEEAIKKGFTDFIAFLTRIIEHGKSKKEIKSEIESEQMAVFILSSIEGALALTRLYKDTKYLDMVDKQIIELLFSTK